MKKLIFILLLLGFIFQLNAGIRVIKVNCPYMGMVVELDENHPRPTIEDTDGDGNYETSGSFPPPINDYDCVHEVNGKIDFCLILQRDNGRLPGLIANTYIKLSINEVQDTLIQLNDFSQNIDNDYVEYTKWYSTSTPIGTNGFDIQVEILTEFCQVGGNPPCTYDLYDGEIFHTTGDNSTSNNPAIFTQFIEICPFNIDDNDILEEETCINSDLWFGPSSTQKNSNTGNSYQNHSKKIRINEFIDIHPNPFNEFITINTMQNSSKISLISLYDAKGKVVKQINTDGNNIINEKIWTENLPIGLYVCEIITGNERKNFKLLKTN